MRLITLILVFFSFSISAQTLETNLRIAKDSENELATLLTYKITVDSNNITFDCIDCKMDFQIGFLETVNSLEDVNGYRVVTINTDESDRISLIYKSNILNAVCIHQINGVNLFYVYSKISVSEKNITYKL